MPSSAPSGAPSQRCCEVNVDIACTVAGSSKVCSDVKGVGKPECQGCAATELCFRYTASSCAAVGVSGLLSCKDSGSTSPTADIVISPDDMPGGSNMVEQRVSSGGEICVKTGGSALPTRLFLFVNAPTGGTIQSVEIDTTCSGSGLTLKDSFGALDLVGFKNCNGNYDCYVDVDYKYLVTNRGLVDLTIRQLNRTLNGESKDLLVGNGVVPADLKLIPAGMFMVSESKEIEICSEANYTNRVEVTGLGSELCECIHDDLYTFVIPRSTRSPTIPPTPAPTPLPTSSATAKPSPFVSPSVAPSYLPSSVPSDVPTGSASPSQPPSEFPSISKGPSFSPSEEPSLIRPSSSPSILPSRTPSLFPSNNPSRQRSSVPSPSPSNQPTGTKSEPPSPSPSGIPTVIPSLSPSGSPSNNPSRQRSSVPSPSPSNQPTATKSEPPSLSPSGIPTVVPSLSPSGSPSNNPSRQRSSVPSPSPSNQPTATKLEPPSLSPSESPTVIPYLIK